MKILNVNMSLDPVNGGGSVERTFQMSRFLALAGVECSILTTDSGLTAECIKALDGINVIALPCLLKRFYVPRFSYKQLKAIIKSADIVHLMGHWTFLNALVYVILSSLNKPYVVCPVGTLPIYGRSKFKKLLYNWLIGNKFISNAKGHIAVTKGEIPHFQSYGVDGNKVSVIPNGVNPDDFKGADMNGLRKKYGLGHKHFIMFLGRLNHIKGPDLLLDAFCKIKDDLKDYDLLFVGPDGGMLSGLKDIVFKRGIDNRVHFINYLGGIDKSNAYHAADLLVIPSRQEAMSIVVLEAGVTGTPVLITDQCGFNEIADINGGLVVSASSEGIAQGLLTLLKNQTDLKLMGYNIKKYVCENFMWNAMISKYLKLYEQILKNK